jgi:hypothetical protein
VIAKIQNAREAAQKAKKIPSFQVSCVFAASSRNSKCKAAKSRTSSRLPFRFFLFRSFEFVSDFGFRISDLNWHTAATELHL